MYTHIDAFIKDKQQFRNISEKTVLAYHSDLFQFAHFQSQHKLTLSDGVLKFIDDLQFNRHLAAKTVKRKITTCKMFYQYLLDEQIIDHDPNVGLRRNTKFIIPIVLPKVLQVKEVSKILTSAYSELESSTSVYRFRTTARNIAILELLASTGMRIGELSILKLEDLKLSTRSVLIHGKNRKERMIYLSSSDTYVAIKQYLNVREQFNPQTKSLFLNKYGNQLSIYGIENIFFKYRNSTNVTPTATPHYLRHTFATELINNGADIREVQELLGHSSITTTTIYANVSLAQKKKVLRKYNYRNTMHIKTSK